MYTKEDFWNSIQHNIRVIKFLFTKIPEGKLDHRPNEKQRSTLEILQYLSTIGLEGMNVILKNDVKLFGTYSERRKAVTKENFLEAIDAEEKEMKEFLDMFTDEELNTQVDIFGIGHSQSKAACLVNMILSWFVAYKMQLFMNIKGSGNFDISTMELWQGMDTPRK